MTPDDFAWALALFAGVIFLAVVIIGIYVLRR
jgi:hypothetical protein